MNRGLFSMERINMFYGNRSNEIATSRFIKFFILFVILLTVVGCSLSNTSESAPQDHNISTIETVIEDLFTGPDQELIDLLYSPENVTIIGNDKEAEEVQEVENPNELDLYLEDKYKKFHFTEDMYSQYIVMYVLDYHVSAHSNDYQMEVDSIEIEQNATTEGAYDFIVNVLYNKAGNEQGKAEVTGRIHIYDDGKIASFKLFDHKELYESLHTKN
jgi:hypothetical protein